MVNKPKRVSPAQQSQVSQQVHALLREKNASLHFYNLLTGRELLERLEALLPRSIASGCIPRR